MDKPLIAIVNDDTIFLSLMNDLLSEEGYRTVLINTSDKAYKEIRKLKPALVILDIVMDKPESGWTVLELLQLDPETTNIPVILASADARFIREKRDWLEQHGIDSIEKPFNLDDLLAKVEKHCPGASDRTVREPNSK